MDTQGGLATGESIGTAPEQGNENATTCHECGGKCCKDSPGAAYPADFPAEGRLEAVADALRSGEWSIDWWEDEPQRYFLRPATVEGRGRIFDPSWGGRCGFLHESGCNRHWTQRPQTCRLLEPRTEPGGVCEHSYKGPGNSKLGAAMAWEKSGVDLKAIGERVKEETNQGKGAESQDGEG